MPRRRLVNRRADLLWRKGPVQRLMTLRSAVKVGAHFRSRRPSRAHDRATGRNRFEAVFGHAPINQPGSRSSFSSRSRRRHIVHPNLAARFVAGRSNRSRLRARACCREHDGKKGDRGEGRHQFQSDLQASTHRVIGQVQERPNRGRPNQRPAKGHTSIRACLPSNLPRESRTRVWSV